jgi:hypothetical protein
MAWWLLAFAMVSIPAFWLLILALFAGPVRAAWREPALRHPVLIIESDDWGPGPASHAPALRRLIDCLNTYRDSSGHPPVMTMGLTLSLPDSEVIIANNFTAYHARPITAPAYADILSALKAGIHAGVFAPQLHGMAHYWPACLLHAVQTDSAVREWLSGGPGLETETLPSPLQSRWIDSSTLPSRPLPAAAIETAVAEEVALYREVFGAPPDVAVPPTFIWTDSVEAAWAAQGVRCIVTPGRRCGGRDANGQPDCGPPVIHNGQHGIDGTLYLVRDRYFEPERGHCAEQGLAALAEKTAEGRPCLLETHRFNFTGSGQDNALAQLGQLLEQALIRHPDLRFTSSAELAEQYRTRGGWLSTSLKHRFAVWTRRIQSIPRFAKLARLSGLVLVFSALQSLDRPMPS